MHPYTSKAIANRTIQKKLEPLLTGKVDELDLLPILAVLAVLGRYPGKYFENFVGTFYPGLELTDRAVRRGSYVVGTPDPIIEAERVSASLRHEIANEDAAERELLRAGFAGRSGPPTEAQAEDILKEYGFGGSSPRGYHE